MEGSAIGNNTSTSTNLDMIQPGTINKVLNFVYSAFTKIKDLGLLENRCFRITLVVITILLLLAGIVAGVVLHSSVGSKILPVISLQVAGVVKLLTSSLQSGEITLGSLQSCAKILGGTVKDSPAERAIENTPMDKIVENAATDSKRNESSSRKEETAQPDHVVNQVSNPQANTVSEEAVGPSDAKDKEAAVENKKTTKNKTAEVKNEKTNEKKGKKGKKG